MAASRRPVSQASGTVPDRADPEVVREMALRHLDRRAYGTAELTGVLVRKGADPGVVDEVLARLTAVGLLNDDAYAAAVVERRRDMQHMSRRAVRLDLRRRGLASDVVDAATSGLDDEADLDGARQLAAGRLRSLAGLDAVVAQRRLAGLLARKGYSPSVVATVVREKLPRPDDQ